MGWHASQIWQESREIEFSPELGLAIEKLPEGATAEQLWAVV